MSLSQSFIVAFGRQRAFWLRSSIPRESIMFQHHPRHSHHSHHSHPSEDTLFDGSGSFRDSSVSYTSESYALLPTPSSAGSTYPPKHYSLGPLQVEEQQKELSWRRRCVFIKRANDSANLCYLHRYMSPYYVVPIAVLVVQTLLLVLSWTFFAITITNPVPLSVEYAIKFSLHVQSVTMVTTLFASSISLLSGVCVPNPFFVDLAKQSLESNSLYTRAIRYALARFTATKVSLYAVFGAIKMANSSPIKNFTRPTWTIVSLLCVIAINAQTAGYVVP